jgi:hypothetical protein
VLADSCQLLEQRLGVLQVGGIETLGEPAVDRRQEIVRLGAHIRSCHAGLPVPSLKASTLRAESKLPNFYSASSRILIQMNTDFSCRPLISRPQARSLFIQSTGPDLWFDQC